MDEGWTRRALLVGGSGAAAATAALTFGSPTQNAGAAPFDNSFTTFVYDESAPEPAGNVFNTWATLVQALADAPQGAKLIHVVESFVMPAGSWDLHGATFTGTGPAPGRLVFITFPDNCTIHNPGVRIAQHGVILVSESTTGPVLTIEGHAFLEFDTDVKILAAHQPFFEISSEIEDEVLVVFAFRFGSGLSKGSDFMGMPGAPTTDAAVVHNASTAAHVALILQCGTSNISANTISAVEGATTIGLTATTAAEFAVDQVGVVRPPLDEDDMEHLPPGVLEVQHANHAQNLRATSPSSTTKPVTAQKYLDALAAAVTRTETVLFDGTASLLTFNDVNVRASTIQLWATDSLIALPDHDTLGWAIGTTNTITLTGAGWSALTGCRAVAVGAPRTTLRIP